MASLFDVALSELSRNPDFANQRLGADDLMDNWQGIIGAMTADERDIATERRAFTAYALAIVQVAVRTKPNPLSAPALLASRHDILAKSTPAPVAPPRIIADAGGGAAGDTL